MFFAGDNLYYDTGEISEITPRCGTLDGYFSKVFDEGEVPTENYSSNFEAGGYQNATDNTKEVNIDGNWAIFAKFNNTPSELEKYKYCFYIKGRLNNAQNDTEIVVLCDSEDITLNDVFAPLLSSQYNEENENRLVAFDFFSSGEEDNEQSDASIGIIGGADGPTAIIVGTPSKTKTIVIDK